MSHRSALATALAKLLNYRNNQNTPLTVYLTWTFEMLVSLSRLSRLNNANARNAGQGLLRAQGSQDRH